MLQKQHEETLSSAQQQVRQLQEQLAVATMGQHSVMGVSAMSAMSMSQSTVSSMGSSIVPLTDSPSHSASSMQDRIQELERVNRIL